MLFFGHIGITLLIAGIVFYCLKKDIDYRFVLVGAILPDLIDKPIGRLFLNSIFHNGRLFAHMLLFIILLVCIGFYVDRKYRLSGICVLAFGTFIHLILDGMWADPGVLFWPIGGWLSGGRLVPSLDSLAAADYVTTQVYVVDIVQSALTDPGTYIPEVIGLLILGGFIYRFKLYKWDNVKRFILTGRLSFTWD